MNDVCMAAFPASPVLASFRSRMTGHRVAMNLLLARILFAFAAAAVTASICVADTNKLNVLFLMSDDLRTELSCYGSKLAKTPNIDKLAASGVRFDRAYCQFPLCNPSRVSMLTGRQPMRTGVFGNRTDFREAHPDFVTLPELFKQNGWAALRAGKIFHGGIDDLKSWTEGGDPRRISGEAGLQRLDEDDVMFVQNRPGQDSAGRTRAQNSDRWIVLEGNGESHGDYRVADRTIDFLRRFKDQPFFMACGFVKPHSPPTAPQKFYDLYDPEKIPLPPDFAPRPTVPEGFPRAAIRPRNSDLFIGRDASPEEARQMIRAYAASTSWMDWNVGRVLAELDKLGLREKTIVVFWGDHGYQLGEKGKWSKAGSLFEQCARLPLIIAPPAAKGNGKVTKGIVESTDIYRTLAELCELKVPEGVQGRSLVPLLENPDAKWDHPAFTIWSEDGRTLHGVAVRTEKYRYAEFTGGGGGAMLFDQAADPDELKNLAADPRLASVRAELSKLIKNYISENQ
jgi:iduronate 2-sulfatase